MKRRAEYFLVFETGTDDYAVGPFVSKDEARKHGHEVEDAEEGEAQGEFIVVSRSRVPARILKIAKAA